MTPAPDWRLALESALGSAVQRETPVGGGCIAEARRVDLADGRRVFVKTFAGRPTMFPREAEGLRAMAAIGAIRVPGVLAVGPEFLALEWVEPGRAGADFMARFGRQFAALHRPRHSAYGFTADNYLGATPQRNAPPVPVATTSAAPGGTTGGGGWADFYWRYRLSPQLALAERGGLATPELRRDMGCLQECLARLLAPGDEAPSLLHGDLWSGNFMVGQGGEPILIDPAAYYGHREADLAMTTLFGGFSPAFYAAYQEALPLRPGWQEREPVYQLYHLLNHLNLFGTGYYGQSMDVLRRCLAAAERV